MAFVVNQVSVTIAKSNSISSKRVTSESNFSTSERALVHAKFKLLSGNLVLLLLEEKSEALFSVISRLDILFRSSSFLKISLQKFKLVTGEV